MDRQSYKIYSKVEDGSLCVGVMNNKVVLFHSNDHSETQLWYKYERFVSNEKDEHCFALVNKATGQVMTHSGVNELVTLAAYDPEDGLELWTESNDIGEGYKIIRLANDIRLCMDAFRWQIDHGGVWNGSHLALCEYWSGENQQWKIVPYSNTCEDEVEDPDGFLLETPQLQTTLEPIVGQQSEESAPNVMNVQSEKLVRQSPGKTVLSPMLQTRTGDTIFIPEWEITRDDSLSDAFSERSIALCHQWCKGIVPPKDYKELLSLELKELYHWADYHKAQAHIFGMTAREKASHVFFNEQALPESAKKRLSESEETSAKLVSPKSITTTEKITTLTGAEQVEAVEKAGLMEKLRAVEMKCLEQEGRLKNQSNSFERQLEELKKGSETRHEELETYLHEDLKKKLHDVEMKCFEQEGRLKEQSNSIERKLEELKKAAQTRQEEQEARLKDAEKRLSELEKTSVKQVYPKSVITPDKITMEKLRDIENKCLEQEGRLKDQANSFKTQLEELKKGSEKRFSELEETSAKKVSPKLVITTDTITALTGPQQVEVVEKLEKEKAKLMEKQHGVEMKRLAQDGLLKGSAPALIEALVPPSLKRGTLSDKDRVLKTVEGILNELTPENFDILKGQILDSGITTADILTGVTSLIFDKSVTEPTVCPMYALLCSYLHEKLPQFLAEEPDGRIITFRRVVLNICQMAFEGAGNLRAEMRQMTAPARDAERRDKERMIILRSLGSIRFIGELIKQKVVMPIVVVDRIVEELLGTDVKSCPEEENVVAICHFFITIGKQLDESPMLGRSNDVFFNRLKDLSSNPQLALCLQLMILAVIDLRSNNWVPRREVEVKAKIINKSFSRQKESKDAS